jgi:formylglycine-generating enzyme required for sulfatase activity/tRNA A-37 threonylcarbamoyl transferase component Bud32
MSDGLNAGGDALSPTQAEHLEQVCDRFEAEWRAGRRPRIEDGLADVAAPGRPALLRDLLELELEYRRQAGETPTPEEYEPRFPDQRSLIQTLFGAPTPATAGPPLVSTLLPGEAAAPAAGDAPGAPLPAGARFRILRPHAQGGLGQVYVARDEELMREVALKQIHDRHADDPRSRARFVLEAEITGRLEHPGVIPVYGLGADHDGRPFYAMRFIRGDSLKEAIARFHAADAPARDPGERTLALRGLLGRFVAVCDAVAYAHSRGVIHRDLKPSNVMLGGYGETLVVDWGLAKAVGRPELVDHPGETTLRPESAGSGEPTRSGSAVGTPGYMSPEQAAGDLDRVGPASDVYSLGATLYHLLTGRAPFTGEDLDQILWAVQRGEFPRPRAVAAGVPRALEAVCLKAMAPRPGDRYPSPRALADDVEHWLAGEPVSAWRESWAMRARRWVGRHGALVAALAAGLLVAMLATSAYVAQRLANAERRVDALATAETRALPAVLRELGGDRRLVRGWLSWMARGDGSGTWADGRRRLPAALALLPDDPAQADFLAGHLLDPRATPEEVLVIRDALADRRGPSDPVWGRFRAALGRGADDLTDAQLRAAGALAWPAPGDQAWADLARPLARTLVRENPLYLGAWREVFQPVAGRLVGPLRQVFAGAEAEVDAPEPRDRAFTLLFEFATRPENRSQPEDLAALVGDAGPDQFRQLLGRLEASADRAAAALLPTIADPARFDDGRARRQGRVAMALLRLGRADRVWPLFRHRDDPSLRTELIHNLDRFGLDPAPVVDRLRTEPDVSARRALILCLGEFPPGRLPAPTRAALTAELRTAYREDPDPGVHSAVDWLLRQNWGSAGALDAVDRELSGLSPPRGRDWFVNGQGQTFAVVRGPVVFRMGSTPESDSMRETNEDAHPRRIGHSFAIATREVTLAQFARFLDTKKPEGVRDVRGSAMFQQEVPSPDCAMGTVTWYAAALYCNWLSAREGLPEDQWCFPKAIGPGVKLPADYLARTGYRLPTEAEWEYACRAGSSTSRPFGGSKAWLTEYDWFSSNSGNHMHPPGQKKPNDLGLFDLLGNTREWCADTFESSYRPRPDGQPIDDVMPDAPVSDDVLRNIRGFAYTSDEPHLRSAQRDGDRPSLFLTFLGFRLARTVR